MKKASNSSPGDSRHHSNLPKLTEEVVDAECPPWLPGDTSLQIQPLIVSLQGCRQNAG